MDYLRVVKRNHQALAGQMFGERTITPRHFTQEKAAFGSLASALVLPAIPVDPIQDTPTGATPFMMDYDGLDTAAIV